MNLRIPIAESPVSCWVVHEKDTDKVTLGSIQMKTFYHSFGENIDNTINSFLNDVPIYVTGMSCLGSNDGTKLMTRIMYRIIHKGPAKMEVRKDANI